MTRTTAHSQSLWTKRLSISKVRYAFFHFIFCMPLIPCATITSVLYLLILSFTSVPTVHCSVSLTLTFPAFKRLGLVYSNTRKCIHTGICTVSVHGHLRATEIFFQWNLIKLSEFELKPISGDEHELSTICSTGN